MTSKNDRLGWSAEFVDDLGYEAVCGMPINGAFGADQASDVWPLAVALDNGADLICTVIDG
jgi:hypothetical protein